MPASSAASTTAAEPAASVRQPKLLHPMPTADTSRDPSLRYSMSGAFPFLSRVNDEFPQIAVRIPEVHARCGSPRSCNVARRTDVIDAAVAQVLLRFLNRAAPNQTKIGISRQRNISQIEFVVRTDILGLVLGPQDI